MKKIRILNAAKIVLLTIVIGLMFNILGGYKLEERLGLDCLFRLRGPRKPPPNIQIVTMDKYMSHDSEPSSAPDRWPRSIYAELVEVLNAKGTRVVCFDINFEQASDNEDDRRFAKAVREAGNVILHEKVETIRLRDQKGALTDFFEQKRYPTNPLFLDGAVAGAPFILPKKPARLNQFWTFKADLDDRPTLPVVLFFFYTQNLHNDFYRLLTRVSDTVNDSIRKGASHNSGNAIEARIRTLRNIFKNDPSTENRLIEQLKTEKANAFAPEKKRLLESLTRSFCGESRYLNYYGPPGTIRTVSFSQVLKNDTTAGKVVFIGLSELTHPDQTDGMLTVFSRADGVDLSGVEILATAFANFLENSFIQYPSATTRILVICIWGTVTGLIGYVLSTFTATIILTGIGGVWLTVVFYQFTYSALWYPFVVPFAIQTPFSLFTAVVLKNAEIKKERKKIKTAFGYYIPYQLVDRLIANVSDIRKSNQMVYGVCMFTDAKHFTSLSESESPMELSRLMNRYYGQIAKPISNHGGIISRIFGDGMLVIWASLHPDSDGRRQACHAALDVSMVVRDLHLFPNTANLPTRIGIHSGQFFYGNIGSQDHYDYTVMGDAVNTASRLENLNKKLGTWILVSEEALDGVDGVLSRRVGVFILAGKTKPVCVHELISTTQQSTEGEEKLCLAFSDALAAFERKSWDEAAALFHNCMHLKKEDGPSSFYLKLCGLYKINPPSEDWRGAIAVEK